jgi:hypothetical protein
MNYLRVTEARPRNISLMPNPAPAATVSDVVGTKPTIDLERGNRSLLHGRIVRQANNYNSTKRRRF